MKKAYIASLCKNGILGGGLYVDDEKVTFRTGKVTVPQKLRNLELYFKDIAELSEGGLCFLPTVTIRMKNGEEWKFLLFFSRGFISYLKERLSVL